MRYRGTALFALLITVSLPGLAAADDKESYEAQARGATRVDRAGLTGLLWALSASCSDGDELVQRQCRAVREARARRIGAQTFIVPGDASAFTVGAFDGAKRAVPLTVTGCIACVEPIAVDGTGLYVLSNRPGASFQGAIARAAVLHESTRPFVDDEAAVRWRAEVVPRLRSELVVKLDGGSAWTRDGKQGVAVEVLGFRVWDPCDGGVVSASPPSGKAAIDKVACGGEADKVVQDQRPAAPALAEELGARDIKEAMKVVRSAADACFETYGVAGDAKLRITVAASGAVVAIEQTGDFADTPTGACIDKAVQAATFPKTRKSRQSFSYPIILR